MWMRVILLILAVYSCIGFLAVPTADAQSQEDNHAHGVGEKYFLIYGGVNSRPDEDITFLFGEMSTYSFEDGSVGGIAWGLWLEVFRIEAEIGFRTNDDSVFNDPKTFAKTSSHGVLSFMLNGYYDVVVGPLIPYLGLGVGIAAGIRKGTFAGESFTSGGGAFAYQFMGGLGFELTSTVTIFAGYRYFGTSTQEFFIPISQKSGYASEEYLVGFRFNY